MQNTVILAASAAVLAMLLVAALLPWLAVNIRGQFSFSLIDAVRGLASTEAVEPSNFRNGDFASFTTTYKDIFLAFAFSVLFYSSAIIYSIGSLISTNKRKSALGPAGTLAIAATITWIAGIEILKSHVLADAKSGGPFAELASGFINSVFSAGSGPYLVLAGGIIALAFYFMKELPIKRLNKHHPKEVQSNIDDEQDSIEIAESDEPLEDDQYEVKEEKPRRQNSENISRIVYKSSGTAALLAFIGAIFGLPGIGHIYVGRIGRGLLILISGFALYVFSWLSLLGGLFGGVFGGLKAGLPMFQTGASLAIILILMYFGLLIWQILDAKSSAKKLNEQVQLTGKEPW